MTVWEYTTIEVHEMGASRNFDQAQMLDGYGKDGWELVSVIPTLHGGVRFYFKRPVAR